MRLEAGLEGRLEAKLRWEASFEDQVESKFALESGWTALRVPRRAAGSACWVQLGRVGSLQPFRPQELRDILEGYYIRLSII